MSPTYKFNAQSSFYKCDQAPQLTSRHRNEETTYDYGEPRSRFLFAHDEKETTVENTNTNNNNRPVQAFRKPAFLGINGSNNTYKFMANASVKPISGGLDESPSSPKVFCHEGTNSRRSSSAASSLERDETQPNHFGAKQEEEEENDEDDEEEEGDLTDNNLNLTTKPMNTPAGFCNMSGASLPDDDQDQEHVIEIGQNHEKSSNNLELGILDLENFISEFYNPKQVCESRNF